MRRVIGMDIHRTFAEVVVWEDGRLRHAGRVDMTRTALEGFGKSLKATDEIVVEATGNTMALVRVLSPFVARVVIANPLQVKAIAHAHVKTDKIDAGVLASLHAAGFLPEVWTPPAETERMRRLVARRNQVVRHRTRIKNEVHAILHAHLIPCCPHADMFSQIGRAWLKRQPFPDDEMMAIERHLRELDRLGEDLELLDREVAKNALDNPAVKRLLTITGVNVTVAAGLLAAIGDIRRFPSPQKLVSYVGLNPRVRQSGLGFAQHGRISKIGRSHMPERCSSKRPGRRRRRRGPCMPSSSGSAQRPSGSRRRGRPQARGFVLASAHQGRRLSLGTSGPRRQEGSRHGDQERAAGEERQQAGQGSRLLCQNAERPRENNRRKR